MDPRTLHQLRLDAGMAWSTIYLGGLTALGKAIDPTWELGGITAAHDFIGPAAQGAYEAFEAELDRLNQAYNSYVDAPRIAAMVRKEYEIAVHNADASVKSARFNYDQVHAQLNRVRAGEYAKYGVTEPDPRSLAHEAHRLAQLEDAAARAAIAKDDALVERDADLASLERIRPGVVDGSNVEREAPELTREERIYETVREWTGPWNRRRYPNFREVRRVSGVRDLRGRDVKQAVESLRASGEVTW